MGVTKTDKYSIEANKIASLLKALAHPARIEIIQYLLKSSTCINGHLVEELGLAQATVSQHLKELKNAEIIQGTIEGSSVCYCINPEKWKELSLVFSNLVDKFNPLDKNCC